MLNQIILDMRDQLAKAKREVAAAIADERKLRAQVDDEVKQARDWERRAMLAVKEGRDDLAKQALLRHQEHAERAGALEQTWQAQAQETEKLKASLKQLNDKIEEAKRKRNLLIAKQKRAQAQKRIHETMSGLSDTSAFDAFNRMARRSRSRSAGPWPPPRSPRRSHGRHPGGGVQAAGTAGTTWTPGSWR
jgi:phage shock protein A